MGGEQCGRVIRILFVLGFLSVQQLSVTDAEIGMLRNGITTVGKTFRVVCTVTDESFVGWFDLTGTQITYIPGPDELPEDKYYIEVRGNRYTLVIQHVVVADGGDYTCRGDKTGNKVFTLFVEFFVTEFPSDQDMYVGRSQAILCSAKGYPKPTFQWYKDRRKVKLDDSHFTLMDNGSLLINPVHELDKGEYICRITQLGDVDQGTNLREEQKDISVTVYGPPRINLEKSSLSNLYSYIGNPTAITIKCVWWGHPVPEVSIRKNNKALPSEDVHIDAPRLEATVTVDSDSDFGNYTCHATNIHGVATYGVAISKAGKPTPPTNLTFATTCDHVTVAWNRPESDGGLPLTHYTIEIKDTAKSLDTVFLGVQTKRFTFTSKEGVKPRTLYAVTVQAFNTLNDGTKGEGAVMSAYCPPSGPFNITNTVTWLNDTSFTLQWTRPPQDGGDPDLRYDIEYSKANSDGKFVHWNSRKNINGQEYNVTGLARESKYEFRVFVSNIAGRKREPASKEFNVYSGPGTEPDTYSIQPVLVYDMSVNCTSFYMQVDFALGSPYLDVETFHFDNASCGSHIATSEHVSLRTPLDACGTTSRQSDDSVTYINKVVAETKTKDNRTFYIVEFPFSCAYKRHETIGTPSFQSRRKITFFEEGYGNFSFEMGLYRNSEYTSPYEVSEYPVTINPFGQLYCQAKLGSSDPDLVLRADTCVATPSMDPSHSIQYKFIDDGCAVDNGTHYNHTMTDTQRFQLVPFRWITNYTLVYLHCNVLVCHKDGHSRCSKGCHPSSLRRARRAGNGDKHRVTLGPIMLQETQQLNSRILYKDPVPHSSTTDGSTLPLWTIILIIFGTIVGLGFFLFGGVHLIYFLASKSQDGGITQVQSHSDELELFCSENV